MRTKKFVHGITFFTTLRMYAKLKEISDNSEISLSELLREIVNHYLNNFVTEKENLMT